jgi:hypothetical protein
MLYTHTEPGKVHAKILAKTGGLKYQWQILEASVCNDSSLVFDCEARVTSTHSCV